MTTVHKHRAVINYGRKNNILRLLVLAKAIYAKMLANQALFPSPTPPLADLDAKTAALGKRQDDVNARLPGAATLRDAARDGLLTVLVGLLAYVQMLADAATPEQAVVIIESAGMTVAGVGKASKPILGVTLAVEPGRVDLRANAGLLRKSKRARTYGWGFTADGGKTWHDAAPTPVAHTSISGLPSLTMCGFRVNVTDTTGTTEWSQVVSILVH